MEKKNKIYEEVNRLPYRYIPIMVLAYLSINLLGLALPLTMKKIYSSVLASGSYNELRLLVGGCLLALLLESILRKTRDSSSKWIASKYEYQLSNYLIRKVLGSYTNFKQRESYHADLEKINSVRQMASFYSARIYQLYIDVPFIAVFLYFIYVLGGSIVWVPIILSVLYVLSITFVSRAYFKHRKEQIGYTDEVMAQLTETLDKIHLVKASGLEAVHIAKFNRIIKSSIEKEFQCNTYQNIPDLISSNFSQLNLFTLLLYGGYLITKGQITFGEITACVMLGGRAVAPIKSIMKLYLQRLDIRILKERIESIHERQCRYDEEAPAFPDDITGTIEFIDLAYRDIQTHDIETLNCTIPAKKMIYIDPRGFLSYKEVVYKLTGREFIDDGKILIDNLNVSKWDMNSLKGKLEYLSDDVGLYKGSVMDNITFFNRERTNHAYEAAALTGLDKIVSTLSDGFETQIDSHSRNYLSAAFLQRLNLTRALVSRPRILILDRIDESMDEETLEMYHWLLDNFKNNMTMVVISKDEKIKEKASMKFCELIG